MFFKSKNAISTKALEKKLNEQPQIIDVREPFEYNAGHIPGAKNVPLRKITNFRPKEGTVYVVCQSGARSKRAMRALQDNGHKDVINVRGGMTFWRGQTKAGKM